MHGAAGLVLGDKGCSPQQSPRSMIRCIRPSTEDRQAEPRPHRRECQLHSSPIRVCLLARPLHRVSWWYRRPFVRRFWSLWKTPAGTGHFIVTLSHSGSPSLSGPARPPSPPPAFYLQQGEAALPLPSGARWLTVSRSLSVCPGPSHQPSKGGAPPGLTRYGGP